MPVQILLSGATGKIGREVERLVGEDDAFEVSARASRRGFFGAPASGDVVIDFSRPELCRRSLEHAVERGVPIVIGTTGLDARLQRQIEAASEKIPVCQAANFSLGVNLLVDLVKRAAESLPEAFDIEISELHHRWKIDAPSGTALVLGRAAAEGRALDHDRAAKYGRSGARTGGEIGYQAARGGDVPGEHTVMFLGDGERLELAHRATDRAIFARGALHAANWLVDRAAGRYSMRDVLA